VKRKNAPTPISLKLCNRKQQQEEGKKAKGERGQVLSEYISCFFFRKERKKG
jgi:hypothetical protein